ncbi:hypothetical protein Tco_1488968 [Tanacetum coccineum]
MSVTNAYWPTTTTTTSSVPNIPQITRPPLISSSFDLTSPVKKSISLRFVSGSSSRLKSLHSKSSCRCSGGSDYATSDDWDWNRWTRHFAEVELAERSVSLLQV